MNFSTLLLVFEFQALVMNPLLIFRIETDSFTGMEDTMDFTLDFLGLGFLGLGFETCFFIIGTSRDILHHTITGCQ